MMIIFDSKLSVSLPFKCSLFCLVLPPKYRKSHLLQPQILKFSRGSWTLLGQLAPSDLALIYTACYALLDTSAVETPAKNPDQTSGSQGSRDCTMVASLYYNQSLLD